MARDTLGWRKLFGVITPSVNTVVQPEYAAMAPPGVVNHVEGMFTPDDPMGSDADFEELIRRIDIAMEDALKRVVTCKPDHIILGISSESVWGGGLKQADALNVRIGKLAGNLAVTQAAHAIPAALKCYGVKRKIALVTPYFPVSEKHLRAYVEEIGYDPVRFVHLSCKTPTGIGRVTEDEMRAAYRAVDSSEVEAIVQFGANLPNAKLAGEAERWLGKPVVCINTVTYWHALRSTGIDDKVYGFGSLLERF